MPVGSGITGHCTVTVTESVPRSNRTVAESPAAATAAALAFDSPPVSSTAKARAPAAAASWQFIDTTDARPKHNTKIATAEYAVVLVAATGFAAVLVGIMKSDAIKTLLTNIIKKALSVG